jgi:hypothetical protein
MKFTLKGYWEPTPKGIRKIADSVLAGATISGTFAAMNEHPKLATGVMIIAVIAKILSNFFTDDSQGS